SMAETMLAGGDFMSDLDNQARPDEAGASLRAVADAPASTTFKTPGLLRIGHQGVEITPHECLGGNLVPAGPFTSLRPNDQRYADNADHRRQSDPDGGTPSLCQLRFLRARSPPRWRSATRR
ncbi:MAG: hypothetical protein ACR2KK_09675, partial [Acidimicrobiales bacterium]